MKRFAMVMFAVMMLSSFVMGQDSVSEMAREMMAEKANQTDFDAVGFSMYTLGQSNFATLMQLELSGFQVAAGETFSTATNKSGIHILLWSSGRIVVGTQVVVPAATVKELAEKAVSAIVATEGWRLEVASPFGSLLMGPMEEIIIVQTAAAGLLVLQSFGGTSK